jgi:hypothetical protein
MKLKNRIISCIISFMLVVGMLPTITVYAESNKEHTNKESLLELAKADNYNIMLYDYNGNIIDEFHADGESVHYTYEAETGKMQSLKNSNGDSIKFNYDNKDKIKISRFKNEQLIETVTIDKNNKNASEDSSTLDEKMKVIQKASQGLLDNSSQEKIETINTLSISTLSDTIDGDYNLSTLCPSIWTSAVGSDKFLLPSTMSESSIQSFLESKNSVLKNIIKVYALDSSGTVYDTGRIVKPSTAIYNAANTYYLNPKVILGSLQREQGLITKTSGSVDTRAFYFCMGYGATDGGDINSCTGFDKQIDGGTKLYVDLWYEGYQKGQNGFPLTFSASDGDVSVNNCGTYALYRYTPWMASNKLFLQIMKGYWPSSSGVNGINWE